MATTCDLAVIGGGVTGLSTAIHAASSGRLRVLVLERHHTGAGQSGRAAGIIRSTVRHLGLAGWQAESARYFSEVQDRFGVPLEVHRTGYLLLAQADQAASVDEAVRTANAAGCQAGRIGPEEARELQPGLRIDDDTVYMFEPGAVHLDPMVATQALGQVARNVGVEIRESCEVDRIEPSGGHVRVSTAQGNIDAAAVMLGTSCWLPWMAARLGHELPIRPHRAEMVFFHAPLAARESLRRILSDGTAGIYLRPEGASQMFVGWREGDWIKSLDDCIPQNPDDCRQTAQPETIRKMHAALSHTLPWMSAGFVHRTFACTYDYSPDGMPILDRLPGTENVYYAAGFSGGGFSLSPFVGRTMAEFIRTGERPAEIAELSERRFAEGRAVQWSNTSSAVRR